MSVSLMAMAMNSLKVPAISLNAFQVAMHTTSVYGNARLKRIDVERIRHELEQRKIVIVTGFQELTSMTITQLLVVVVQIQQLLHLRRHLTLMRVRYIQMWMEYIQQIHVR